MANGLGRVTQGPDELTFEVTKEGTFNYGCPVAEHCQAGMLVQVRVSGKCWLLLMLTRCAVKTSY